MATLTPNLGLTLPADLSITNPDWGVILNSDFTLIDSILGVPVTPGGVPGININANLPFNGWSATGLFSISFDPQISTLPSSYFDTIYIYNNGVWFNDNSGVAHQVFPGSGSAAANVFYTAPTGTASAQYSPSLGFSFFQAVGPAWYGAMNVGALNIFDDSVSGVINAVTLQSPASLALGYPLTLPTGAPSALSGTSVMTVDTGGNMGFAQPGTINPTIAVTGTSTGSIGVVPASINQVYLAVPPFTQNSTAGSASITAQTFQPITHLAVTISLVAGRPTLVQCQGDNSGASQFSCVDTGGGGSNAFELCCVISGADSVPTFNFTAYETGVVLSSGAQVLDSITGSFPASSFSGIYIPTTTGSHTFTMKGLVINTTSTLTVQDVILTVVQF